ncbi:MAG: Grx4 family monothiol glutaredoxin [Myxococcales bacterium]|nr:Grx4 family monothiol glutaredoxin [Myxococcales bacterium]
MSPDLKARIENDIKSNKIMIFMKGSRDFPQCGFSAAAVDVFNRLGVDYETRDVLADMDLRQGIKEFSNWPTIPQVYVDGEFIGGCDIVREMFANGELEQVVSKALGK